MQARSPGCRTQPQPPGRGAQRGLALLTVLWTVMLLALIAANASSTSRTSVNLARNLLISAQAEATADAGVHLAILALIEPEGDAPEGDPASGWPERNSIMPEDGTPFEIQAGGGTVVLSVQDEAGLLNLNHASTEELRALMVAAGIAAADAASLADSIVAFRSPPGGQPAAVAGPAGTNRLAGAKHGFFEVLEELQQVEGFTPALYRRIAPFVTADARPSRLDPAVAPPEVLLAVTGLGPDDLAPVLMEKSRPAREAPLEQSSGMHGQGYRRAPQDRYSSVRDLLAPSQREIFTIRAQARTTGGGTFVREARVYRSGDPETPFRILGWSMGRHFAPASSP